MQPLVIERHDCRWETVAVQDVLMDGYGYMRTALLARCVDCGLVQTALLDGHWTEAQITGPAMPAASPAGSRTVAT